MRIFKFNLNVLLVFVFKLFFANDIGEKVAGALRNELGRCGINL